MADPRDPRRREVDAVMRVTVSQEQADPRLRGSRGLAGAWDHRGAFVQAAHAGRTCGDLRGKRWFL
jgi:hypothetical protein